MGSNNVIQFPGGKDPENKKGKPTSEALKAQKNTQKFQPLSQELFQDKKFLSVFAFSFLLVLFNLLVFQGSQGPVLEEGTRGVASVSEYGLSDVKHQFDLANYLSQTSLDNKEGDIGRTPSSDDQVRHGVLSSRGYIFQRDLESGNLTSIQLQSDEHHPAYLLNPNEFLNNYGNWLNKDFQSFEALPDQEQIEGDMRVNYFLVTTTSGKTYQVKVVRDMFRRLTSLSQTEVAANAFN
ncbi:MAG: hypothetical protein CL676_12070 [Bdellovibrionaceae bacterium]|nr:hypothetical protein [Pseudobdellovibrionaceae bacterium]|tara:strand:- start:1365 stop:2075 length:711 start_codon:yes stop_codon:yes gene_type:complete